MPFQTFSVDSPAWFVSTSVSPLSCMWSPDDVMLTSVSLTCWGACWPCGVSAYSLIHAPKAFSQNIHRVSKKLCQCYFVNNSVKHWPNLIIFGTQHREETWHKRLSFAHLTLILLLHYLVKCRSRSLDVYNDQFMLDTACRLRKSLWDQKIIENLLLL